MNKEETTVHKKDQYEQALSFAKQYLDEFDLTDEVMKLAPTPAHWTPVVIKITESINNPTAEEYDLLKCLAADMLRDRVPFLSGMAY